MRTKTLLPLTLLAAMFCGAWPSDPHASANVTIGKGACNVIHLPTCWHNADGKDCIAYQSMTLRDEKGGCYKLLQERDQPNTILIGPGHIEEPLTQTGPYGFGRREI